MQLGFILNADLIEEYFSSKPFLHLDEFGIITTNEEFSAFFKHRKFFGKTTNNGIKKLFVNDNILIAQNVFVNSYLAAAIVDFLKYNLLKNGSDFSYETVMSHPSKVNFITEAKEKGYRTYLYFVGTNSPDINIRRVKSRQKKGGHRVSEEKIIKRYYRSLNNLLAAIKASDRAYLFDNSRQLELVAVSEAGNISLTTDYLPYWVEKFVFKKLTGS